MNGGISQDSRVMESVLRGTYAHKLPRSLYFRAWCGQNELTCPALSDALSFEEALAATLTRYPHKSVATILLTDEGKRKMEARFYVMQRSNKKGYWRDSYDGGPKVFEPQIVPKHFHTMTFDKFEPTRSFDAFRDDPVGNDKTLVER